jgi:zinc transport system ATP-binding protein
MNLHANNLHHAYGTCCHHPEPVMVTIHPSDEPLIKLDGISIRRDDREILSNVRLTINRGDFVAITGPNGGGKTTLLRIILGLLKPSKGSVTFPNGRPAIGYLPQKNMIDSHFPISVRDVVASGLLTSSHLTPDQRSSRIDSTLATIEMTELAQRPIGRLSGGQLQRALLGRAIISQPDLLVLDEPLSYIDKHFESHIYRIIAAIAPNCTIMLVSHEMSTIASMANRHWIIDRSVTECTAAKHYVSSDCDD